MDVRCSTILLVLVLIHSFPALSNGEVDVEIKYDYAQYGRNMRVGCTVSGEKFVGWISPTGNTVNETKGRIYVESEGDVHMLYFVNIDDFHTGQYTCQGERNSATYSLYIDFVFATPKPFQELVAGQHGVIECNVVGSPMPVITWRKNGEKLDVSEGSRYRLLRNGSLWIHYVTVEDAGKYVCRGVQGRRSEENPIEVDVLVPPNFIQKPAHSRPTEGYQVTFLCGAEGRPTPKIAWFKDGRQILSGGRYNIKDGNLVILNVQRDDVGNYTCRVSNKFGVEETRATIEFVYAVPKINPTVDLYVNVTSRVQIECNASGNPLPTVTWWRRNDEDISDLQRQTPGKSVLLLSSVQESDQGTYVCRAENGASNNNGEPIKDAIKMMLYVQTPPVFNKNKSSHVIYSYLNNPKKIELRCALASGFPTPDMTMIFPSESPAGSYIKTTRSMSFTTVTDKENQFGTYTCIARNILGREAHDIEVIRVVPPSEPLHVIAEPQCDSVVVNWKYPHSDGGRPVEKYFVRLSLRSDVIGEKILDGLATTVSFKGLGRGKKYLVQIKAKNMAGFSATVHRHVTTPSAADVISLDVSENYTSPEQSVHPRCTVTCDQFVGWFDPRGEPITSTVGDITVENIGDTHILHVKNMKRSKPAGRYHCRSTGASVAYTLYLWVGFKNTAPEQYLLRNTTDVIKCEVSGTPTPIVRWFNNETEVSGSRFKILPSGSLQIANTGKEDDGLYRCSVTQGERQVERNISVSIVSLPSFNHTPENKLGTEGMDTSFTCAATGDPQPEIVWLDSAGKPLTGPRYFTKNGILTISEVRTTDIGKYICRAQSVAGYIDVPAHIQQVYTRPRIVIPPQDTMVQRGQNVSFLCKAKGNPTPTIYWQDSTGRKLGFGPTLKISSVIEDIEGLYYCVAKNQVGKTKAGARMTVRRSEVKSSRRSGASSLLHTGLLILCAVGLSSVWILL